jgi:hypothetical protein
MMPPKKTTPLDLINKAYHDAANAIEFCNWYTMNRVNLEKEETQLIIDTWDAAIEDAEQDIEHTFNGAEYWMINYKKPKNDD